MTQSIIFKYKIELGYNCLRMPVGAKILTAQIQRGDIQLWALCPSPQGHYLDRVIMVHGTGWPIVFDPGRYVATVQSESGTYVWHVFEVPS
jgi:hypothetical protein